MAPQPFSYNGGHYSGLGTYNTPGTPPPFSAPEHASTVLAGHELARHVQFAPAVGNLVVAPQLENTKDATAVSVRYPTAAPTRSERERGEEQLLERVVQEARGSLVLNTRAPVRQADVDAIEAGVAAKGRTPINPYSSGFVSYGDVLPVQGLSIPLLDRSSREPQQRLTFSRPPQSRHLLHALAEHGNIGSTDRIAYSIDGGNKWLDEGNRPGNAGGIAFNVTPATAVDLQKALTKDPTLIRRITQKLVLDYGIPPEIWAKMRPPYEQLFDGS